LGNLFIADTSDERVRRVDALTKVITTVAGNGTGGFSGDGGPATSAELNFPTGAAVDTSGNLFIADGYSARVRKVALPPFVAVLPGSLTFGNQNLGTTSTAQSVTLTNTGLVALIISSLGASAGFAEGNNCGSSINPGASCTLNISFAPTVPGSQTGTITITDNAFASPHMISLSGTGVGSAVAFLQPVSLSAANS
jgi:hypothetical protein